MSTSAPSRRLQAATLLCVLAFFLVSARVSDPFVGNQNTYYPHGLRAGGVEWLAGDWFANTRPAHPAFSAGVAALVERGALEAALPVIRACVQASLFAGLALFALVGARRSASGIGALFVYAMLVRQWIVPVSGARGAPAWWVDLLRMGGLAGQTLHSDALEPASFGAFLVLGLGLLCAGWARSGALACGFAALVHPTYLLHGAVAVGAGSLFLWTRGALRQGVESLLAFTALALPSAIGAAAFARAASGRDDAVHILAAERIPHHAIPAHWFDAVDGLRIVAIGALLVWAVGFVRRSRETGAAGGAAIAALSALALVGVALGWLSGSERLGLLFPWRSSVALVPVAVVLALRAAIDRGLARVELGRVSWAVALAVVLATTIAALAHPRPAFRAFPEVDRFADRVREATPRDAVVLVPARLPFEGFRLRAERALPVDYKSHPYWPDELLEWRRRVQWARAFERWTGTERQQECGALGATHYVVDLRDAPALSPAERPLVRSSRWALVECPLPAPAPDAQRASAHAE